MALPVATARQSIQSAIEQRVEAQWLDGGNLRTAVQFPGVVGLKDTNGQIITAPPPGAPWLQVDVIWGASLEATFGTIAENINAALIQLSVFVPRSLGKAQLNTLVGLAAAIFDRYNANNLRCRASDLGPDIGSGGYLQGTARTRFEFYTEAANQ